MDVIGMDAIGEDTEPGTDRQVDRTRPLWPYPQAAKYKGSGNIDDAASFACALP